MLDTQENAVTLRTPCALTLNSGAPDAWKMHSLLMKEQWRRYKEVQAVTEFRYHGDMLSAGGGCKLQAVITRCTCSWGKVMPTSTASHQPQCAGSDVFNVHEKCMCSTVSSMLSGLETRSLGLKTLA